jgi:hypothetical protein
MHGVSLAGARIVEIPRALNFFGFPRGTGEHRRIVASQIFLSMYVELIQKMYTPR